MDRLRREGAAELLIVGHGIGALGTRSKADLRQLSWTRHLGQQWLWTAWDEESMCCKLELRLQQDLQANLEFPSVTLNGSE